MQFLFLLYCLYLREYFITLMPFLSKCHAFIPASFWTKPPKLSSVYLFSPAMWWPLWTPWSGRRWWTPPGTCTWVRQSRPRPWPPGRPARAGWAPTQEAGCLWCTRSLSSHICLWTRCFYRKTWKAGRTRGSWRARLSTGRGPGWSHCAGTQTDREAAGGGKWGGGGGRGWESPRETWRWWVQPRSGSKVWVSGWGG